MEAAIGLLVFALFTAGAVWMAWSELRKLRRGRREPPTEAGPGS
jgi:hypothetical protein